MAINLSKSFTFAVTAFAVGSQNIANAESFYSLEANGRDALKVVELTHSDIIEDKLKAEQEGIETRVIIFERYQEIGVDDTYIENAVGSTDVFMYNFGGIDPHKESNVTNGSASSTQVYGSDENYEAKEAAFCVLKMPDEGATAAEWTEYLSNGKVKLEEGYPDIYDQMFNDYVRFHEQAHCFEADETQADFMAIQHMNIDYGNSNPMELNGLLEKVKEIREATNEGKYKGSPNAIRASMQEIANGTAPTTHEAIRGNMVDGKISSYHIDDFENTRQEALKKENTNTSNFWWRKSDPK
ncbi:MAG: hypothetical protein CMH30_02875 [Micavibrio sp.]|nr:hypothetical protein [Micavibrio sp.]